MLLSLLTMLACRGSDTGVSPTETDTEAWVRPDNRGCLAPSRPVDPDATIALEAATEGTFTQAVGAIWHDGDWLVVEKEGFVRRGDGSVWVDLTAHVFSGGERGLLGLAIDGDTVYVSYTAGTDEALQSVVESFPMGQPDTRTRLLTVDQPAKNHNGGRLAFDAQGNLVLGLGDGGGGGSPTHALDPEDPLGNMLRYTGQDWEPIAWGLRNPWGWSFDRETGELWVADVGWQSWEEVNKVPLDANLGWPAYEGTECIKPELCTPEMVQPLVVYDHDAGKSVTGGYVSRGPELPALEGVYLYGDFVTGRIWGLDVDVDGQWRNRLLLESGMALSSFAEDGEGNVHVVEYGNAGRLHQVVSAAPAQEDDFPYAFSETGCADEGGLIPYDVILPLWSDGADKDRWLGLPDGSSLELDGEQLHLPVGGVAVKHFLVGGERVETRLLARDEDGYAAYSYVWEGDDARFSRASSRVGEHYVPSQGECMQCHTADAGFTLSLDPRQFDDAHRQRLQPADVLPVLDVEPFQSDARAYLHVNCSSCHQDSDLDLRVSADIDWCAPAQFSDHETLRDALLERMGTRGAGQMPPLATDVVDGDAIAVLEGSLPDCP